MSIGTILIIILVIVLLGGVGGPYLNSGWQPGYGYGWYGNGCIGNHSDHHPAPRI